MYQIMGCSVGVVCLGLVFFVFDFGVKGQFLGVVLQLFSHVLELTVVKPLSVDEFPDCVMSWLDH